MIFPKEMNCAVIGCTGLVSCSGLGSVYMVYLPSYVMEEAGEGEEILLFVYNADSGVFSELKGYIHKAVSPSTYDCPLCTLTHGSAGMKKTWKAFLKSLDLKAEFLYRDEMAEKYSSAGVRLPAVFKKSGSSLNLLINAGEIGFCKDLEELMDLVTYKLKQGVVLRNVQ